MFITHPPRQTHENAPTSPCNHGKENTRATSADAPQANVGGSRAIVEAKGQTHGKELHGLHRHGRGPYILQDGARTGATDDLKGVQACDPKHEGKRARARLFCTQARRPVVCDEPNARSIPASKPYRRQPREQSCGQSGMVQRADEHPAWPRATQTPSPRPDDDRGGVGTVGGSAPTPTGRGLERFSRHVFMAFFGLFYLIFAEIRENLRDVFAMFRP